jgi:preprotein translocase subunit YajC
MLEKLWFIDTAYAQEAAAKGPSTMELLIMPLGFILIFYFLVIRPQQKRAKEQSTLLQGLKPGDEVVTSGGIIGRVKSVADTFVSLDVASSTTIKVLKTHVSALTKPKEVKEAIPVKAK